MSPCELHDGRFNPAVLFALLLAVAGMVPKGCSARPSSLPLTEETASTIPEAAGPVERVSSVGSPADSRRKEADSHCRVGLYMHDAENVFYSAICPPKVNCRTARPGVPAEDILCMIEYLGSPRAVTNQDIPDMSKNLFRFRCSSQAECRASNELCYTSSAAMEMAANASLYEKLTSTMDAAVICA